MVVVGGGKKKERYVSAKVNAKRKKKLKTGRGP
jgi:hypothetical protein